jgi:hypothetical protein
MHRPSRGTGSIRSRDRGSRARPTSPRTRGTGPKMSRSLAWNLRGQEGSYSQVASKIPPVSVRPWNLRRILRSEPGRDPTPTRRTDPPCGSGFPSPGEHCAAARPRPHWHRAGPGGNGRDDLLEVVGPRRASGQADDAQAVPRAADGPRGPEHRPGADDRASGHRRPVDARQGARAPLTTDRGQRVSGPERDARRGRPLGRRLGERRVSDPSTTRSSGLPQHPRRTDVRGDPCQSARPRSRGSGDPGARNRDAARRDPRAEVEGRRRRPQGATCDGDAVLREGRVPVHATEDVACPTHR